MPPLNHLHLKDTVHSYLIKNKCDTIQNLKKSRQALCTPEIQVYNESGLTFLSRKALYAHSGYLIVNQLRKYIYLPANIGSVFQD